MKVAPKKGRKCRKHGRGVARLARTRWGTYAGLFAHQKSRRTESLLRRFCVSCSIQFHSRAAFNRHACAQ